MKIYVLAATAVVLSQSVYADVFKCVDNAGRTTYTNNGKPINGGECTLLSRDQNVSTYSSSGSSGSSSGKRSSAASNPSPTSFPKVDDGTQKSRDNDRRQILEQELGTEEKSLEQAKQDLAKEEETRLGNEKNYQKKLDRIKPFQDKVDLHQRNIESIRKEISNLK